VEPLETYDDKIREVRIQKICLIDIDHDPVLEVIVWVKPYYHQPPPIFIYQILTKKTVYRLREAPAPGLLQDFNQTCLDVHKTGKAADMQIPSILPMERMLLTANYLRMKSHVVEYRSFSHIQQGKDTGYYVDLMDQPVFNEPDRNSCLDLQFVDIEDMIYGRLDQNMPEIFMVKAESLLSIYQLTGFNQIGLFNKKTMQTSVPTDFIAFVLLDNRMIHYRNNENELKKFRIDLGFLN